MNYEQLKKMFLVFQLGVTLLTFGEVTMHDGIKVIANHYK